MSEAKNHHYVPQFLLRQFAEPASRTLYAFDKRTLKTFSANPRNVAAENYFYEIETGWGAVTLEPGLADLETRAAAILRPVIEAESIAALTPEDRVLLSVFFAVQFTRTRQVRESMLDMSRQIAEWLAGFGFDPDKVDGFKPMGEEDAKLLAMKMIDESRLDLSPHFLLKTWLLVRNATGEPLLLSDNPVALHNSRPARFYGNLGLASEGIEIHIPVTPRLSLNLMCPSFEEQVRRGHDALIKLKKLNRREFLKHRATLAFAKEFMAAVDLGKPIDLNPDNVLRENSLQVRSAERWLFSCKRDFALATEMVSTHPDLVRGPRMTRH